MKIQIIDIDKLIPYHNNPRKDQAVDKVASSINEYGFQQPIVVDKNMVLIVGHTRLLGAKKLGLKQVPVHIADLSEAKAKAYRIADNRLNEDSNWDFDLLDIEVKNLLEENYDIDLLGFDSSEIDKFLKNDEQYLTDEDEVPEPPKEPITKLGDIWILDNHRLMCGNSTNIEMVNKLMPQENADLVFTDPPYNVDYSGRGKNKLGSIKNDNMKDEDFSNFCSDFFSCFYAKMKPLSSIYVCHPDSQSAPKIIFETIFAKYFKKSSTIIWMKQSAGMGWQDYRVQHEPILYGWKEGKGKHYFIPDRSKTTIWKFNRDSQASYVHPTQKPVSLSEEAILNSSKGLDIVLDLFGGSGSTLISCEKTNRKARLMELDPKYCDVIIKRWENFTGKKAKLLNG
tara:strand:- start:1264 stop:2454 length:1191 start_codon:yes stop_codon:yes gene_type:complete